MEKLATTPAYENEWVGGSTDGAARDRDETVSIDTISVLCPQYGSTWEVQGSEGRGLHRPGADMIAVPIAV